MGPLRDRRAPNYEEWEKGWRVFTMAMVALNQAQESRLELYRRFIKDLVEQYGADLWWIIVQGDFRMRFERMVKILRAQRAAKVAAVAMQQIHPLDDAMPWDWVFRCAAVEEAAFWQREVRDRVMQYLLKLKSKGEIQDDGYGEIVRSDGDGAAGVQGGPPPKRPRADPTPSEPSKNQQRKAQKLANRAARGAPAAAQQAQAIVPWTPPPAAPAKGKGKGKGACRT